MNKSVVVLIAALAISIAMATRYRAEMERERARADALATRIAELDRPEAGSATPPTPAARERRLEPPSIEPMEAPRAAQTVVQRPKRIDEYAGSAMARRQVERLQAALVGKTPLQEYQIQSLIDAIDRVETELTTMSLSGSERASAWRERIIQAAIHILFESQVDVLIELLDEPRDSARITLGDRVIG